MPARTAAEQRAEIDGRLEASLGKFDEQLRREQQRNAEERDGRASNRADSEAIEEAARGREVAAAGSGERTGDLRSEGAEGTRSGTAAAPGDPAEGAGGSNTAGGGGGNSTTRPIPSGDDDDIIARRLRRAAESETDPELKEKLWKEYRDYKENTGGRS